MFYEPGEKFVNLIGLSEDGRAAPPNYKICPHIKIAAEKINPKDIGPEYWDHLVIRCEICQKEFLLNLFEEIC